MIERLRNRQVKNLLALTLLSAGAPILLMGDEVRARSAENSNAYCRTTTSAGSTGAASTSTGTFTASRGFCC
jgi:pullulanase/glycogen debranching enzyme